jgi:hypothetical protein
MIRLPDIKKAFKYENDFYLSCDPSRIGKMLTHYELFKQAVNLPGAIMEFGVFKGVSLARFAIFRSLFSNVNSKKIIGFDTFNKFPKSVYEGDRKHTQDFIKEAGSNSISKDQLFKILKWHGLDKNVELIEGDICDTGPEYVKTHPELKISLLHLDVDLYEPTKVILNYFYPKVVNGGVIIFDDYATFGGETKAIDEYFESKTVDIRKFPFSLRPSYMIKTMD